MLPDHCKDVSVRKVDFDLTPENIISHSRGAKAYTRTEFIILKNGNKMAVIHVDKEDGKELFIPIKSVQIISLPDDVVYIRDESIDVLNASQMARIAEEHPEKTVVVQGTFNHISFVQRGNGKELRVLDVIPPEPSKLSVLVERALISILSDMPIIPKYEEIDLRKLQQEVKGSAVVFPCEASGISSEKDVYYLDQTPDIPQNATLIGCDLSGRIYRSHYKKTIQRIEMCPQVLAPQDGRKRIVKCCRIKEGFEIKGNLAVVPWGANVNEVAAAIKALFS